MQKGLRRSAAQRSLASLDTVQFNPLGLTADPHVASVANARKQGEFGGYGVKAWDPETISLIADNPDPRAILELARMHHWVSYAVAAADGDTSWFKQFKRELKAFAKNHPPMSAPLWNVAMDNGIRVYSMLLAADIFHQHGMLDEKTSDRVATMAAQHAICIEGALETAGGMSTSHLLGDLLGLIAVNKYTDWVGGFPAENVFREELNKQILSDGMSFEASTGYHLQVVDILVHIQRLLGEEFPLITKAVEAQAQLESFGMPLIGDNDDGLVIKPATPPKAAAPHKEHVAFPGFGLWMWRKNRTVLTARNGQGGQYGKGGHSHADANSITVSVDGKPMIVDPGCSVYTANPSMRNIERSSSSHATVNLAQTWFPPESDEGLFWHLHEERGRRVHMSSEHEWEGVVSAFGDTNDSHTRHIDIAEHGELIRITDTVTQLPSGRKITIPLGIGCRVEVQDTSAFVTNDGVSMRIDWRGASASTTIGSVSTAYAHREPSHVLNLHLEQLSVEWSIIILNE